MSDNEAAVLITGLAIFGIVVSRLLKFIQDMSHLDDSNRSEAKPTAWDDEL